MRRLYRYPSVGAALAVGLLATPVFGAESGGLVAWLTRMWNEFDMDAQIRDPWVWFGFGAQGLFFGRFIWQWIVSERRRRSTIPVAFWYLSLAGGLSLFVYAAHRRDLVIMAGQLLACVIYVRNLMLIHGRASRRQKAGLPTRKLESAVDGGEEEKLRDPA